MKKKKLVFQSDCSIAKTGFGRNSKAVLSYLFKTGKYDIVQYACGMARSDMQLKRTPWKTIGSLPDNQAELEQLKKDPHLSRMASYGANYLDAVIEEEKPDVYIAVQDIWGIDFALEKPWFDKINSVFWTTLDSLPILPSAVKAADKVKNYWIWSDFATKALHEMGHTHIKTVHGAVDHKEFKKLNPQKRAQLRQHFNLPQNTFIIGYVFRNQLRKSVPNLLEGYKKFKNQNPRAETKLLLHTHFGEGWNIHKLADEYGIDKSEILTTYVCKSCLNYEVKPFIGMDIPCRFCSNQKSLVTTQVGIGVKEWQLNEVYNLMDVYCHPFTSGGQEIPVQEAKLAELITLVTNYSCGEELCQDAAKSLALEWTEYREHGTEFKKASTSPLSIARQLKKVFEMKPDKRQQMGQEAREWTIENFAPENVGKFIENFIDSCEYVDYSKISIKPVEKDPFAKIPEEENNSEWVKSLYKHILKRDVDEKDDGHAYWMQEIAKGASRQNIDKYFRDVAFKENKENKKTDFEDFLDKDDEGKRILYVMPESERDIYLSSSLFQSLKKQYPKYNLYVATDPMYFALLDANPHVHKCIPYFQKMDDLRWLEGIANHKGYFEIAFLPHVNTQRISNFTHNGKTNIAFDLKETCTS